MNIPVTQSVRWNSSTTFELVSGTCLSTASADSVAISEKQTCPQSFVTQFKFTVS